MTDIYFYKHSLDLHYRNIKLVSPEEPEQTAAVQNP